MKYNYSKLKGRIVEKCGKRSSFAKDMGLSERSLSCKLNNRNNWKQDEIVKAMEILDIAPEQLIEYFFALKVQ